MSTLIFESELRDAEQGRAIPQSPAVGLLRQHFGGPRKTAAPLASRVVTRMFMAIFEGELGDARFIELTQSFCDHAIILVLGRACEW
jgi:hypothetical protein